MPAQSPDGSSQVPTGKIRSRTGQACCRCRDGKLKCSRSDNLDTTPCERCVQRMQKGEPATCEYMSVAAYEQRKVLSKQTTPLPDNTSVQGVRSHSYSPPNGYDTHAPYSQSFDHSPIHAQNWQEQRSGQNQHFEAPAPHHPFAQAQHVNAQPISSNSQQYIAGPAHGPQNSNPYPYSPPGPVEQLDQTPRVFLQNQSSRQGYAVEFPVNDGFIPDSQYTNLWPNLATGSAPAEGGPGEPQFQPGVGYNISPYWRDQQQP